MVCFRVLDLRKDSTFILAEYQMLDKQKNARLSNSLLWSHWHELKYYTLLTLKLVMYPECVKA